MSSFWGFSSLIEQNHVSRGSSLQTKRTGRGDKCHGSKSKAARNNSAAILERDQPTSLVYSNVHRPNLETKYRLRRAEEVELSNERRNEIDDDDLVNDRCQSLNLYQNLVQTYTKRRHVARLGHQTSSHHNRSGQSFHRHHYYHHHHHHSSSRHTQRTATRCANTNCSASQPCLSSSSSAECLYRSCPSRDSGGVVDVHCASRKEQQLDRAGVWGQLIKINKSGGSQVIELQRAPGRSWGFFVARGAINNVKGKFYLIVNSTKRRTTLTTLLKISSRNLVSLLCSQN